MNGGSVSGWEVRSQWLVEGLTDAVGLHVALARHTVSPQTLVGEAARQTVLHPVVGCCGDHQQDVPHDGAEQAPSHKAVHPEWCCDGGPGALHTRGEMAAHGALSGHSMGILWAPKWLPNVHQCSPA